MTRYVCIHGHFYQPPRENPWLEAIQQQDSAHPYHDWNHRITAECYGPNAAARILDDDGWIVNIVNNYSYISFNVGPTLLSWMEVFEPRIYRAILEADRESARRFGGHGSALAQVYNHMIMPLACERDKRTQVRWGIRDFERRFGRRPTGMWLAETAADRASLAALVDEGIEYTVLAPGQCARVRELGGEWYSTEGASVDTTRPYWVDVGGGRRIAVFFYHGPTARAIAFEGLLNRGEAFAERLMTIFSPEDRPQLANIATDGETYGHHHRYGEMGLAYALHYIERNGLARLTNYGEYLELHPPTHEAEIVEPSSWSCFHGVERWRADCGCRADPGRGWNQAWRRPLRDSLDWLRDRLAAIYEQHCILADPWKARDEYIDVVLNRSDASVKRFLEDMGAGDLAGTQLNQLLGLLEMQRHAMLMFTSCGWFFDELSGIETIQCIQYAGRAIQLAMPYDGDLERQFLERIGDAKSNLPALPAGDVIYERAVKPAVVDLANVVAHYAVTSMFEPYGERSTIYGFDITRRDYVTHTSGRRKLVVGRVDCRSLVTRESATLSFAALHLGDHNLSGGVRAFRGVSEYEAMRDEVTECFLGGDLAELMRMLDRYFLEMTYSLKSLFRDEQRKVLSQVLEIALEDATEMSRRMHRTHAALIRYVVSLNVPLPQTVRSAADFILNANLKQALSAEVPDPRETKSILAEARGLRVELETAELATALQATMEAIAERFAADPLDPSTIAELLQTAELVGTMPFEVELFRVQNRVFQVGKRTRPELLVNAADGDEAAAQWLEKFSEISQLLRVRVY